MNAKHISVDTEKLKLNIKQNWLKINDEHLQKILNRNDLANVIEDLYQFDANFINQQIDEWINNQIEIDGHIYQTNLKSFN